MDSDSGEASVFGDGNQEGPRIAELILIYMATDVTKERRVSRVISVMNYGIDAVSTVLELDFAARVLLRSARRETVVFVFC